MGGTDLEPRIAIEEAIDFIIQAWTNEPFSFEGRHSRARDLSVVPRPLQSPHPPVRVAANSPDTFPFSGRRQLPIFASPLINPPDKLKAGLAVYRDALAGRAGDTALAFPVHVTTSRAQARQDCEAGLMRFLRVAVELVRPKGATVEISRGPSLILEHLERAGWPAVRKIGDRIERHVGTLKRRSNPVNVKLALPYSASGCFAG